jgi:sugar phosphate isomerase/epimerase
MVIERTNLDRRQFLASMAAAGTLLTMNQTLKAQENLANKIPLGFDNFSVRAFGWKIPQLLDYAASQKVDVLLVSDLDSYDSFDDAYLASLKEKATKSGITLQVGTGGICPTSKRAVTKFGTQEEHLALLIKVAKAVGSPVARCYLGSQDDRKVEGGIFKQIESTVEVLKKVRNQAIDAEVKFAVENHAGDMQAWELAELINAAGKDFVGATMDSGNATWTIETPMTNLEILGPYAVTSGMRDSAIWESKEGAFVQWTNMGEGQVHWQNYLKRYT